MKPLFFAIFLYLFFSSISFGQSPDDYMEVAKQAIELFSNQQFEESIPYFDKLIRWRPNHALNYVMKGRALYSVGKKTSALEYLDYAIKIDPKNAESFYYRSLLYSQMEYDEMAVQDIKEALRLDHENMDYLVMAANFSSKAGYYERAIKLYERIIEKGNSNPDVYYFIGFSNYMYGDSVQAIKYLNVALDKLSKNESNFDNDLLKGSILSLLGNEKEALAISLNDINKDPNNSYAYELAADSYRVFKQWDNALEMINKACQINKENPFNFVNKAYYLIELDSLHSAKIILDDLIISYPDSYNILVTHAYLYIKLDQPDIAIGGLNRAISKRPNHPGAYKVRAEYYFKIGEKEEGCKDIDFAILKAHQRMYNNNDAKQLKNEFCN